MVTITYQKATGNKNCCAVDLAEVEKGVSDLSMMNDFNERKTWH